VELTVGIVPTVVSETVIALIAGVEKLGADGADGAVAVIVSAPGSLSPKSPTVQELSKATLDVNDGFE